MEYRYICIYILTVQNFVRRTFPFLKIMSSQTQPKLHVIELSEENLKPGSIPWSATSNEVCCALEEHGCFIAKYEEVPLELHSAIFKASNGLFDLPIETKLLNASDKLGFGYAGNYSTLPIFEAFGIENGTTPEGIRSFADLMWPSKNDDFCKSATLFSKLLAELGNLVVRMVFECYGIEKYYESHVESTTTLLRFIKYRPPLANESNVGLHPHTDKNFLGILDQNQVKGLLIETKDGEWIEFEPSPSTLLVLAGDAFMAWSNGRIHAPFHRVVMKGNEAKYTIGLFWFMRDIVEAPAELVDEEHPLRFKPFNQFEFLQYCNGEGSKLKCPIKVYCGI